MSMNFTDLLNESTNSENFEKPIPAPIGTYTFQVSEAPSMRDGQSKDGDALKFVSFPIRAVDAHDDIEPEDLEEFGDITKIMTRVDFIFNESSDDDNARKMSIQRLLKFLEACGLNTSDGRTLGELMSDTPNAQFMGKLTHRADKDDPEIVYPEVRKYFPLES
jgi:hypothetical protein